LPVKDASARTCAGFGWSKRWATHAFVTDGRKCAYFASISALVAFDERVTRAPRAPESEERPPVSEKTHRPSTPAQR
jgi:hypothetical protein